MKKRFDIYKVLFVINLFLLPVLSSVLIIIFNNYEKFNSFIKTNVLVALLFSFTMTIICIFKLNKQKRIFSKIHLFKKITFVVMFLTFVF